MSDSQSTLELNSFPRATNRVNRSQIMLAMRRTLISSPIKNGFVSTFSPVPQ